MPATKRVHIKRVGAMVALSTMFVVMTACGSGSNGAAIEDPEHSTYVIEDPEHPPYFIVANPVDPSKVISVSKFRSGMGHDFSVNSGETCRSMKHYVSIVDHNAPDYKKLSGGDKKKMPLPVQGVDVPVFSPVDGVLAVEQYDDVLFNRALNIVPDAYPNVRVRLMHVTPLDSVPAGTHVKAGQQVGLVLRNQVVDYGIEEDVKGSTFKTRYISFFMAMDDNTFAAWTARGATSRDEFVFTREQIDAKPWKCKTSPDGKVGNEEFVENYVGTPEGIALNLVTLNGS